MTRMVYILHDHVVQRDIFQTQTILPPLPMSPRRDRRGILLSNLTNRSPNLDRIDDGRREISATSIAIGLPKSRNPLSIMDS